MTNLLVLKTSLQDGHCISCILQMRKLGPREVECLAPSHSAEEQAGFTLDGLVLCGEGQPRGVPRELHLHTGGSWEDFLPPGLGQRDHAIW